MWAAVVAVVVEPPVLAVVDLAHLPVLALAQVVARRVQLPLLPRLPAKAHLPVPALRSVVGGLAQVPVVAHVVVEPAVAVERLSRQSCSAAMARSTS